MLTEKTKRKRKGEKELNSFKKKMGNHLIWFNSLTKTKQYDVLYMWKYAKYIDGQNKTEFTRIWNVKSRKFEVVDRKKLKLKHWIVSLKQSRRFSVTKMRKRNSIIDILLDK